MHGAWYWLAHSLMLSRWNEAYTQQAEHSYNTYK